MSTTVETTHLHDAPVGAVREGVPAEQVVVALELRVTDGERREDGDRVAVRALCVMASLGGGALVATRLTLPVSTCPTAMT